MQFLFGGVAPDWLWIAFLAGILVLLLLDLTVIHKDAHEVKTREAILISIFWIALSLIFNAWFAFMYGPVAGLEFLTGYLVEKSLSLDNVFVILLIFHSLGIAGKHQHRILFWGILGAIILRGIFILVGASLLAMFHWILYIFGVILIISGVKFLFSSEDEIQTADHWAVRALDRLIGVSKNMDGQKFLVRENGRLLATPLLVALVLIEITDLIFAVDSIPAVFAVTRDPFIAFGSNILAILGLRALFFVVAQGIRKLRYLKPGLAVLLGFVGVKLLLAEVYKIPIGLSLAIIALILLTAGLGSWYADHLERRKKDLL